jgi:hypothetical protein
LVLAQGVAGCGGTGSSSTPLSPSILAPVPPPRTVIDAARVAGIVYDSAFRVLGGALIEVVDGPHAGLSTVADAEGHFSLSGTFDDDTSFRASKEGHLTQSQRRSSQCLTCNPNYWVYFTLAPLVPPVNLAGNYTLTFIADSACAQLPSEVRTRSYEATVTLMPATRHPTDTFFELTFGGAPFLTNFKTVPLHVAGDYFAVELGDFHGQPGLVEQVAETTYLAFSGSAPVSVGTSTLNSISVPFEGLIEYCVLPAAMGSRYSCEPVSAGARAQCQSTRHRLVLERR